MGRQRMSNARKRESALLHTMEREANTRVTAPTLTAPRAATPRERTVSSVRSSAIFPAMHIQTQTLGHPTRGAWLTRVAGTEPSERPVTAVEYGGRTVSPRVARILAMSDAELALAKISADRRAVSSTRRAIDRKLRVLAEGVALDRQIFPKILADLRRTTYTAKEYAEGLNDLELRKEASEEWAERILIELELGDMAIERALADIAERRAAAIQHGWITVPTGPVTAADCPFWDVTSREHEVKRATRTPDKITLTSEDHPADVKGNKFLDKGMNND